MKITQHTGINLHSADFLDNLSDGVVYIDKKLSVVFLNAAGEKMLGWKKEEVAGQPLYKFFALPQDLQLTNLASSISLKTKSGKPINISVNVSFNKEAGSNTGFFLTFKQLDQDHGKEKDELKYKGLFEHALEGILVLNEEGRVVDVNPAACNIYDFKREQFLKLSISDLFPHKSDEETKYIWNEFLRTGRLDGFYKFQDSSSRYRYIDFQAKANFIPGFHLAVFTDVTEKRAAEQALRQSEAHLKAVFNSSQHRILLLDLNFKVVTLNKLAVEVSSRNGKAIFPGDYILDCIDGFALPHKEALLLLDRAKSGQKVHFESSLYKHMPDYWVEINIVPVYNEQGNVSSICISTNDISARKKTELALADSEARFRSLVQNSSDLVMVLNKEGKITYASPSSDKIIGYKDEVLLNKLFDELVHKEDLPKIKEIFRKVISGKRAVSSVIEYRMHHPEGYYIFVETGYTNLINDPHIEGIVLNTRDVSERKFQEESLLLLERAIDSSDNGIVITDPNQPDNPIIYANKAFELITGYSYLEMIGKNCRVLQGDDTKQSELIKLRKALKSKKKVRVTLRNYRKDGSLFWNELNISPVLREGNVTNFIGVLNDITERKLAEDALLHITRGISGASSTEFLDVLATHLAVTLYLDVVLFLEYRNEKFIVRTNLTDGKLDKELPPVSEELFRKLINASGLVEYADLPAAFPGDKFVKREKLSRLIALPLRSTAGNKTGWVLAFTRTAFQNSHLVKSLLNILSVRAAAELERDIYLQVLRTSEQKFRGLAENSPDLIMLVTINGQENTIDYVNKKSFFGHKTSELVCQASWQEIQHPDETEYVINHWINFLKCSSGTSEMEYRIKKKKGDFIWVMSRLSVLESANGKARRVLVSIMDINERKRAENALREGEDQLRALIENTDDIIWSVDRDLRITTMNFAFKILFRQKGRRNLKEGEILTDVLPENISDQILEDHVNALNGSRVSGEFTIKSKARVSFYEISFNPIYSDEGSVSGVSVFARNITERKKAENDIIRTNFELDSFVYRASHDLRAPLRSVLGLVNLVKNENQKDIREQYLSLVEKSIGKLDTFISDLTNFSRNSRLEVDSVKIDFGRIIDECSDNLRFMEKANKIMVQKRIIQKHGFYSDSTRIAIIIQNLLSNCIKYQNDRKQDSYCRISIKTEEDHVKIIIKDNGRGIKKEYLNRIFNMFFRASEDSYGSGLGLYITKQVVEKLKGSIEVQSEIGQGTVFKITLPNARKIKISE